VYNRLVSAARAATYTERIFVGLLRLLAFGPSTNVGFCHLNHDRSLTLVGHHIPRSLAQLLLPHGDLDLSTRHIGRAITLMPSDSPRSREVKTLFGELSKALR